MLDRIHGRTTSRVLSAMAVLAVVVFGGRTADAQFDCIVPAKLENDLVKFDFVSCSVPGSPEQRLLLKTITNKSLSGAGAAIHLDDAPDVSGEWTVRIGLQSDKGDPGKIVAFSSDGEIDSDPTGTASVSVSPLSATANSTSIYAAWTGTVNIDSQGSQPFKVTTGWVLGADEPFVQTDMIFEWTGTGTIPYYLSEAIYPSLYVSKLPDSDDEDDLEDVLVVPYQNGILMRHPTVGPSNLPPSPTAADYFPLWMNSPEINETFVSPKYAAYYSEDSTNGLLYTTDDGDDHWKFMHLAVVPDDGETDGYVAMHFVHVPPDTFDEPKFTMRTTYDVRLGVTLGDWWDIARTVQDLLVADEIPWYHGPVGSPGNPMPQAGKDLISEAFLQGIYSGDNLDNFTRTTLDLDRLLGSGLSSVWYGGYYPDVFGQFYRYSYLPGRPSLAAAVRESQKQHGHIVQPYFQSSAGFNWETVEGSYTPTSHEEDLEAAFVWDEDQEVPSTFGLPTGEGGSSLLCVGTQFFQDLLVDELVGLVKLTGIKGVYLDFFLTPACYREDHAAGNPGDVTHLPGGGNWMHSLRQDQIQAVLEALDTLGIEDFFMSMEGFRARHADQVHLMHMGTFRNLVSARNPGMCNYGGVDNEPAPPMDNVVVVPLFKMVYDGVKIGRIGSASGYSDAGHAAWFEANSVFTFGQTIGFFESALEEYFQLADKRYQRAYHAYLGAIATALREGGLLTWHNGTLRRLPEINVSAPNPAFPQLASLSGVCEEPFCGPPTYGSATACPDCRDLSPSYVEKLGPGGGPLYLTPGMFQAPSDMGTGDDGSLAFVLSNPFIGETQATISFDFTFDPSLYPGWEGDVDYEVEEHFVGAGGLQTPSVIATETDGDPYEHPSDALGPGEIVWWVFRQT